eukprot:Amastigsp_a843552_63.p1 type:complete len:528 gc:universal Amastigsp_a843552_63:62-1645(+)
MLTQTSLVYRIVLAIAALTLLSMIWTAMQPSSSSTRDRVDAVVLDKLAPCPPCEAAPQQKCAKCPTCPSCPKCAEDIEAARRNSVKAVTFANPSISAKRSVKPSIPTYRTKFGGLIENRPVFLGHDLFSESRYVVNRTIDGDDLYYNGKRHPFCIRPYELYPEVPHYKNQKVCLPSYVIVGVLKGGTSSVYMYLTHHPDVYHPVKKEVCWLRYTRVPGSGVDDVELYREKFPLLPEKDDVAITGEGCPFFLPDMGVPELLYELLPHTRLILLFRNPVDRLYSMFNMRVRYHDDKFTGNEVFEDFVRCWRDFHGNVECQSEHRGTRDFIFESKYVLQMRRFIKYFPLSPQWIIGKSEEFYENERFFMSELYQHLGLADYQLTAAQLTPLNTDPLHDHHKMSPILYSLLHEFYAPYNEELYSLLDFDFGWNNNSRLYARRFPFNELYSETTGAGLVKGQSEIREYYVPGAAMWRPDRKYTNVDPDTNVALLQPGMAPDDLKYQFEVPIKGKAKKAAAADAKPQTGAKKP